VTYDVSIAGLSYKVELLQDPSEPNTWVSRVNGRELRVNSVAASPDVLSVIVDGRSFEIMRERNPSDSESGIVNVVIQGLRYAAEVRDPRALRSRRAMSGAGDGPKKIVSPMPGKVVRLLAAEGGRVIAGAGVLVIEAMKMQNELKAPKDGLLKRLAVSVGATVNAGDVLAIIE
jgi:biotin carboxyl carrier protein